MFKNLCLVGFVLMFSAVGAISQEKMMSAKTITVKEVSPAEAAKNGLKAGAQMPSFTLGDANGKQIGSDELLKKGNLVVVFYRGAWCPFCNLYLKKLQDNAAQIKAAGGNIVAISVETPDRSLSIAQKNKLEFTVLSDPNFETARKFGIVYQLPEPTNEKYIAHGLDLAKYNSTEKAELPLSATYVVNQKGEIVYAFLEPDYQQRAEPAVIIENLLKIKTSKTK